MRHSSGPQRPGQGPVEHQPEVKAAYWALFDPTGEPPGERSITVAQRRAREFTGRFEGRFPAAVACLNDDLASLFAYLRFPVEHHKRPRHANFIERTFGETRRRVKVIGRLPANAPASAWYGPCSTGPAGAGAA